MIQKKNVFSLFVVLFVFGITAGNIYILKILDHYQVIHMDTLLEERKQYTILISLFVVEGVILYLFLWFFFLSPIVYLQKYIAYFLSGQLKNETFLKKTSLNPYLQYILEFFDYVIYSLKNIKDEFLSGRAIKSEVQLAMEIQEKLLSKKSVTIPSLEVVAQSKPAEQIGGDSYDIIEGKDNYYLYVGDATGHGVASGFVMVMVNALVSAFAKMFHKGDDILAYTNEILKPRIKSNILMTLLLLRWNEKEKRLFVTGAGHEHLAIYKYRERRCYFVKSGGLALGAARDIRKLLKEREVVFELHDIVVLYTDGITESLNQSIKNGNEQMFGKERLQRAIETAPTIPGTNIKTAQSVFNNITIELSKFMGYKHKQFDDITLMVIHYKGNEDYSGYFSPHIDPSFITEWNWNNSS